MVRTVVKENPKNIAVIDVFSALVENRIIFIDGVIDDELANGVIAQMLYLNALDKEKEISIYINSPGGSVYDGLAIWDVSKVIEAPIKTVGIGLAASMGAFLMLMGKKRVGLKHSRYMLHQVSSGMRGKFSDIEIELQQAKELQDDLYKIIKEHTTIQNPEELLKPDNWYNAEKALEIGILTEVK